MRVRHKNPILERLEVEPDYTAEGRFSRMVIRGFRKAMWYIRQAVNELDLRRYKALHYHKLNQPRDHQHAVDMTEKDRLILEWEGSVADRTIVVVDIEDYH